MRQKLEGGFINEVFRENGSVYKHYTGENLVGQSSHLRKLRELYALKRFGGNLAPELVSLDGANGIYQEFLQGSVLETIVPELTPADFFQTGQLLRQIHTPVNSSFLYTQNRLLTVEARYRRQTQPLLDHLALTINLNFDFSTVAQLGVTRVHRDFWLGNVIATPNGLKAIDWEFSGLGSPYEDFAIVDLWVIREYQSIHPYLFDAFYSGYGFIPDQATVIEFLKLRCLQFLATTTVADFKSEPNDGFYHNKVQLLRTL